MNEEELKKGCGKQQGRGLNFYVCGDLLMNVLCPTCQARLEGFQKGKLEQKKKELEFLSKVIENSLINLTFIGNSNKDKEDIIHNLLEVVKIKEKQLQKEIGDDSQQPRMKQTRGGELKSDEGLHSTDNGSPADTLKLNHKCPICDKDIYLRDDTVNEKGVIYHLGCYLFENHFTINDSLKDIWDNPEDDRWDKEEEKQDE